VCTPEPFTVTTNDGSGTQAPTVLRVSLTGVRKNASGGISATIGTTVINASSNTAADLPGTDLVTFVLPATVNVGDLPIIIAAAGAASRDATTAPHITINAGGSPLPNPLDGSGFFVRQQYLDFLNREPDAPGLQFWTNNIDQCGIDANCVAVQRINTSAAFFLSIEFQQTGYLVYRTYKAAFGNPNNQTPVPITRQQFLPDTRAIGNGVIVLQDGWQQVLETNKQNYFANFVTRSDFVSKYQSLTAQQFVDALYGNAGIAPASAPNRAVALGEFNSAPPTDSARAKALRDVAEDSMLYQQEYNKAFVLMEYFGYLQRNPNDAPEATLDYQGYNFWLTKLNQFNGDYIKAEMVKAFLSSSEYRQRFGQ